MVIVYLGLVAVLIVLSMAFIADLTCPPKLPALTGIVGFLEHIVELDEEQGFFLLKVG